MVSAFAAFSDETIARLRARDRACRRIASNRHGKHLPGMSRRFGAGLVIETRSLPNLLVATLATLHSMSLIPSAPFPICGNRRQCARCDREEILLRRGYGGTSVVVQAPTRSANAHSRAASNTYRHGQPIYHKTLMIDDIYGIPPRSRWHVFAADTATTTRLGRTHAS